MDSACAIPNCRKKAPDHEAFCASHRDTAMTDLSKLADRVESAGEGDQRAMLQDAWWTLFPKTDSADMATFLPFAKFCNMLDAEAWESAAMMLVPENHAVDLTLGLYWPNRARVLPVYQDGDRWLHRGSDPHYCANGTTPALALCAASLRAIAALRARSAS